MNLIQVQNYPRLHVIITKNSGDMSIIEFQEFLRSIFQWELIGHERFEMPTNFSGKNQHKMDEIC